MTAPSPDAVYTNDRDRLLAAIRAADARDDTPRLMYADWLEEHGTGDRDAATLEFIRRSCKMAAAGKTRTMPRDVYPWLHRNWTRFLPVLMEHVVPVDYARKTTGNPRLAGMEKHMGWWNGRWATVRLRLRWDPETHFVRVPLQIEFWRGFVTEVNKWDGWTPGDTVDGLTARWLYADQPLAKLGRVDDATRTYMPNFR